MNGSDRFIRMERERKPSGGNWKRRCPVCTEGLVRLVSTETTPDGLDVLSATLRCRNEKCRASYVVDYRHSREAVYQKDSLFRAQP